MAANAVQLCSRALVKLGAAPIAAFDEGTAEAEIAATLYAGLRDAVLSAYPWSFATRQAWLPRLATPPRADYAHAFRLPPDFLRALSAGAGEAGRGLVYRLAEQTLHCAADAVLLTYVCRPVEAAFPAFFDHLLVSRLAAEFCIPVTENASRAEVLARLAEAELARGRGIDAQQDTPPAIADFALLEARY